MNEQDELAREIRDRAERLPIQTPSPQDAMVAGRRRRRVSIAVTTLAALVIAVGVALPLRALTHLGEDAQPKPVRPVPTDPSEMIFFSSLPASRPFPDEPGGIYSMPPDGSVVFQLTDGDDDYSSVSVSPDGTRMAYVRLDREGNSGAPGPEAIYVAKANGSDAVEIFRSTSMPQSLMDVQWSPDGESIAFILRTIPPGGGSEGDWTHRLWIMGADGSDPHPISDEQITSFSWSPAGDRFAVTVEATQGIHFVDDIFVMHLDGSKVTRLTDEGASRDPIWSPNGEQVAFTQGWVRDIATMVMNADGSAVHALPVDYEGVTQPLAWSPNSEQVLLAAFNDQDECSTLAVSTSGETLTLLEGGSLEPARGETPGEGDPCVQSASWFGGGTETPTLLVSTSGPSGDTALLTGILVDESGCVAVTTLGGPLPPTFVVWPAGYSLAVEGSETWLLDDEGNRVAAIGDPVQMGGGVTNLAHAEPSVQGGIPAGCETGGPDAYWFAGTPEAVIGEIFHGTTVGDLSTFSRALGRSGLSIREGHRRTGLEDVFQTRGSTVSIEGDRVMAFEYPSEKRARDLRSSVSDDAYMVGSAIVDWTNAHLYQSGRLVVVYLGTNPTTIGVLDEVLGPQFAPTQ